MLFSSPPQNIFLQPSFQAILIPTIPLEPQIQWGFPIDIVCNTNLFTYLLSGQILTLSHWRQQEGIQDQTNCKVAETVT